VTFGTGVEPGAAVSLARGEEKADAHPRWKLVQPPLDSPGLGKGDRPSPME
jgi:hypothetical protein